MGHSRRSVPLNLLGLVKSHQKSQCLKIPRTFCSQLGQSHLEKIHVSWDLGRFCFQHLPSMSNGQECLRVRNNLPTYCHILWQYDLWLTHSTLWYCSHTPHLGGPVSLIPDLHQPWLFQTWDTPHPTCSASAPQSCPTSPPVLVSPKSQAGRGAERSQQTVNQYI